MKSSIKGWQSRVPKFPQHIYLAALVLVGISDPDNRVLVAHKFIFNSLHAVSKLFVNNEQDVNKELEDQYLMEYCLVAEADLFACRPLYQRYWEEETHIQFPENEVNIQNMEALLKAKDHLVLVTTAGRAKNREFFSWAYSPSFSNLERELEAFIRHSNLSVDHTAKMAGLYQVSECYGWDWSNKKKVSSRFSMVN